MKQNRQICSNNMMHPFLFSRMFKWLKQVHILPELHEQTHFQCNLTSMSFEVVIFGPETRSDVSIPNYVRMNITRYLSRLWLISRYGINKFFTKASPLGLLIKSFTLDAYCHSYLSVKKLNEPVIVFN